MNESETSFDWVRARWKCSLERIFLTLREVLDSDVKSFNDLKRPGETATIRLDANNKVIIGRSKDCAGYTSGRAVVFELAANEIRVKGLETDKPLFSAKPDLNPKGRCLLEIEGQR